MSEPTLVDFHRPEAWTPQLTCIDWDYSTLPDACTGELRQLFLVDIEPPCAAGRHAWHDRLPCQWTALFRFTISMKPSIFYLRLLEESSLLNFKSLPRVCCKPLCAFPVASYTAA